MKSLLIEDIQMFVQHLTVLEITSIRQMLMYTVMHIELMRCAKGIKRFQQVNLSEI